MPSEIRVDKVSSTTSPYTPVFSTTGEALSHRNMIINGAMQVYQRGSLSITQTNNGGFALYCDVSDEGIGIDYGNNTDNWTGGIHTSAIETDNINSWF